MKHTKIIAALVVALGLCSTCTIAAQKDAAADMSKEDRYHLAMGKTHNSHVNDHAVLLSKYAKRNKTVPAEILKDHTTAMNTSLQAARKSYAKVRAASKDNPEILKQLDLVDKRLAKVSDLVKKLETQSSESTAIVAQTAAITQELAANNAAATSVDNSFYNMDSSNYYTDGLGHFVD